MTIALACAVNAGVTFSTPSNGKGPPLGTSLGAIYGSNIAALEPRIVSAILIVGGALFIMLPRTPQTRYFAGYQGTENAVLWRHH